MTLLNDKQIQKRCLGENPMIESFIPDQVREVNGKKVVSYGVTSYGYDMRVGSNFLFFDGIGQPTDPLERSVRRGRMICSKDGLYLPPHSFILASSVEYFRIPRNVLAVCVGKSTYARCGLYVGITPLEPGWEGDVTIEVANVTPYPVRLYANQGIAQVMFHRAEQECATSYADRNGKYQGQRGITLPKG